MKVVPARTMPGVLELLPAEQIAFQRMLDKIRRGYERFGFVPIETPVMEFVEILLTKSGGDTEKQVYFVQSTGARQQGQEPKLALRFDLTVPLARYVAEHEHALTFPFRRYQIQRVYRGESAQKGRFREFYQCDIDVIGKDTLALSYDAEIPAIIAHVFAELGIGDFVISINNRKLLGGLFRSLGIDDPAVHADILREIDKLDKIGVDAVRAALAAEPYLLGADRITRILEVLGLNGPNLDILRNLSDLGVEDPLFRNGLEELSAVIHGLGAYGVSEECFRINLSIARGLDYYTGTVYETHLRAHPEVGSVCSGGRYDNLAQHYTRSRLPGVGISIGATRLFDQLRSIGLIQTEGGLDVLIANFDPRCHGENLALATQLRARGVTTEVLLESWGPGRQLKYASRRGARFVIIRGEAERQRGVVALKDMRAQTQDEFAPEQVVEAVAARLGLPARPA